MLQLTRLPFVLFAAAMLLAPLATPASAQEPSAEEQKQIEALVAQLADADVEVKRKAAVELGKLGVKARAAVPALGKVLNVFQPDMTPVRIAAAEALLAMGPHAAPAVPDMIEVLNREDEFVHEVSLHVSLMACLGKIGAAARPAVPVIVKLIKDARVGSHKAAIECAGNLGPAADAAVEALTEIINSPMEFDEIRIYAIHALGKIGTASAPAAPRLLAIVSDLNASSTMRRAAAQSLGLIGAEKAKAVGALASVLGEPDTVLVFYALRALGRFGGESAPAVANVVRVLSHGNARLREVAAETIGSIGAAARTAAAAKLKEMSGSDTEEKVRAAASKALAAIGG